MLGGGQSSWRGTPFSYRKVCDVLSAWLGIILFVGLFAVSGLEPFKSVLRGKLMPLVALGAIMALVAVFQRLAVTVVWKNLSPELRERMPFDTREAMAGKGTIKSYKDLWRWAGGR